METVTTTNHTNPVQVGFHLPGLRYNYPLNMMTAGLMKSNPEFFREGVYIASFFGDFPTTRFNGGRYAGDDQCDERYVRAVADSIHKAGIPIRYTFTNPLITEEDLSDPYSNFCLEVAHDAMNGVLVVSPLLEAYIREHYPLYKLNSSTCKEIRSVEGLNEELKKDYDLVVLDYNMNNQFELLSQIEDKARCEVLVNSCCVPNCPRRGAHYREISKMQSTALDNRTLAPKDRKPVPQWHCSYGEDNTLYTIMDYPTFVSPDAIWDKYVPMGFRNFKIEGRTANLFALIDTYCMYLMKPEKRDEGRLLLTYNLQRSKVITCMRPKRA